MYRGTTPTITYNLTTSLDLTKITALWVTLKNNEDKITFTLDDSEVTFNTTEGTIKLELTQQQTLDFKTGVIKTQIRFLMEDGMAYATPIKMLNVNEILKDGVIS